MSRASRVATYASPVDRLALRWYGVGWLGCAHVLGRRVRRG